MPHPNQPVVVRHPEVEGHMVPLDPSIDYDSNDVLVKAYPHFFAAVSSEVVDSVKIERATAEPGQKRTRTKPAK